jgi:hypothetical protein
MRVLIFLGALLDLSGEIAIIRIPAFPPFPFALRWRDGILSV